MVLFRFALFLAIAISQPSIVWASVPLSGALVDAPEKAPGAKSTGKVFTWTAENGLVYEYYVPKGYDHAAGANLTFILHGSNLDRRWGFANHTAGKFRAQDIVVSPDGTTSNGKGRFNYLQGKTDLTRFHELHDELKATFNVRATYLYGHSQGSFFSFYYAGAYPDEVQGVLGHASGVWLGTQGGSKHHHQAIALMHGTADTIVPHRQSAASLSAHYLKLKYPMARLRSLDDRNHQPSQHHAAQQLAWCEGMTTDDPARVAASIDELMGVKEGLDPVALWQVAERALGLKGLDAKARKNAERALKDVDKAADAHVAAIAKSLGKNKGRALKAESWVGHVPLFIRHFHGMPQCDELEDKWSKVRARHRKQGAKHAKDYWGERESDPAAAFKAGVALVAESFLRTGTDDARILDQLDAWGKDAKSLKLKKSQLKAYKAAVPVFREALAKGKKAFDKVGRRFR